jgi:predicted O-linked N-acetylglucosamine transferase (SPINDLY family)
VDAQELLGASLFGRRQYVEAADVLQRLLAATPGYFPAIVWLARSKAALSKPDECLSLLAQAAQLAGSNFEALKKVAGAYASMGAMEQALPLLEKADSIQPDEPETVFKKAQALLALKRKAEAVSEYRRVIKLRPDLPLAYANLGGIHAEEGRYEEARKQCEIAVRLGGSQTPGLSFLLARLSPVILESVEQIDLVRKRIKSEFEHLRISHVRLKDPFAEVGAAHSLPTYHGRPSRELQEAIARTYLSACRDLAWEAPSAKPRDPSRRERIRVGVCSAFMLDHTIAKVMHGLFQKLDRRRFEVVLFRVGRPIDPLSKTLEAASDRMVLLEGDLTRSRQAIADAELDILLFTDFGAEPLTSFLSFSRLAPVQSVLWGFPDTSGVPNLDYFASTAVFEPPNAQEHYSETLIALPRLYTYMSPPQIQSDRVSKRELGVSENDTLYLCAQSLFKVHPDFDAAILGILKSDPRARIVFFEGTDPHWSELLRARFEGTLGGLVDRIVFVPRLPAAKFQAALKLADAVIDTKHFTGGYTTTLAFAQGVPVVTWNGSLMRGRMTAGFYRLMGLDPLAADSDEEFVRLAVQLATDPRFKTEWQAQIRDRCGRLFLDEGSVRDFEKFLVAADKAAFEGRKLSGWEDVVGGTH